MYNLPLSQHLKPQETQKESLSARRPTNQTMGSSSPLPNNKLKNPSSASKITYISDYKGAPFSKDELETEIKEHIKALKDMRSELGKQKSLILSHLETSDGSKPAAGSQSVKHSFARETKKTPGSASATHAQGIERSFLGNDAIKKVNESSPRKGDFTRSYEKLKTEPSEVRKSHKLDQVYSQLMEDKHYFDYKKLKGRTGSRDGAANFFGEAPTRNSGLFTQLAPTSIIPNKSQESSPKTYHQKSNPYTSKPNDASPSFIKLYSGASQIPSTYLKDESPFHASSTNILTKHGLTDTSPQRYSAQNRAQRSKELLDKILPSKTFLPPRARNEVYSRNTETETEVSLRSRNPDEEEKPRKAHARRILVEDSDQQINVEKAEEQELNPSSPFRMQEEKRIIEYQNIIGELQERIRSLETERTFRTEETLLAEKIEIADLKDDHVNPQNSIISQLEQENISHIQAVQQKDQEIQQLKETLRANEAKTQDLHKNIEKLSAQVNSLQSEQDTNSEQTHKLVNSLNELKEANQSNEELLSKFSQLEKDHSNLQLALQEKSSQLKTYQDLSNQINQLLGSEQAEPISQINKILKQSKSFEDLLAQEKQHFADFKSSHEETVQKLQSQIHEARQEKNSLVAQINSVLQHDDGNTVTDENLKQILIQLNQFKTQEEKIQIKVQELSKNNDDLLHQIKTLQDKVSQLEKEKTTHADENAKSLIEQNKNLQEKNELYQVQTKNLESQNAALLGQLTALKNSLQLVQEERDTQVSELENLQTEKTQLQENIEKTENLLSKANNQLKELNSSISAAANENQKLQHQYDDLRTEKNQEVLHQTNKLHEEIKSLQDENARLNHSISATADEKQKLQHQLDNLKTEKEQEAKQANKFQEEAQKKSHEQIELLKEENKKLKDTLQEREKDTAESKKALDDLNTKVLDLNQEKYQVNQKVTTLEEDVASRDKQIEALKYDLTQIKGFLFQRQSESSFIENDDQRSVTLQSENSFSQDVSTSFREISEWETGGALKSKSFKEKTKTQDESNKGTEYVKANPKLKHQSFSMKVKKPKDEDPIRSSYEKIIRELNEKIANNEKNYKKEISLKVVEANKHHLEKEEQLQAEIDSLQEEKANLLKKIEDIEWDKAYEHNDKTKPSSIKMDDTPSAQVNVESEAKKKKKKKKKAKANDPDES